MASIRGHINHGARLHISKYGIFNVSSIAQVILVLLVVLVSCVRDAMANEHSRRLFDKLLKSQHYNKLIRPVRASEEKVVVKIGLRLAQLIDLDEQNQFMTTNVWVMLRWQDFQLRWEPEDFGTVEEIYVPAESIWTPDIVLYNNADGRYQLTMKTKPKIRYDGTIKWYPPASLKSSCDIDVRHFPFDEQFCTMRFGSWTYNIHEVDIEHVNNTDPDHLLDSFELGIETKDFYRSVEWDVMSAPARKTTRHYAGSKEPFPEWVFGITIRRKFMFYTINLIIPLVSHAFLTILVFYLPSDSREKISLCINILLSLTVYFLMLAEIIPPTSMVVPLLAEYLLFTMALVTLSVIITAVTLNVHFRTAATHTMPDWVRKVFLYTLPRFLRMRRPKIENSHDLELKHIKLRLCSCFASTDERPACDGAAHAGGPRYQFGSRRTRTQNELMRLSQSLESTAVWGNPSTDVCPAIRNAIDGAIFIANHLKEEDVAKRTQEDWKYVALVIDRVFLVIFSVVKEDWKYVAMVIDRIFLIVYITMCCIGTAVIICNAPMLFDNKTPII